MKVSMYNLPNRIALPPRLDYGKGMSFFPLTINPLSLMLTFKTLYETTRQGIPSNSKYAAEPENYRK